MIIDIRCRLFTLSNVHINEYILVISKAIHVGMYSQFSVSKRNGCSKFLSCHFFEQMILWMFIIIIIIIIIITIVFVCVRLPCRSKVCFTCAQFFTSINFCRNMSTVQKTCLNIWAVLAKIVINYTVNRILLNGWFHFLDPIHYSIRSIHSIFITIRSLSYCFTTNKLWNVL